MDNIQLVEKLQANKESEKIITIAKDQITNEKMKAITELKNHVAWDSNYWLLH